MIPFLALYVLSLPALILLILLGIVFEAYDNVMSIYTAIAAAAIAYVMYDIPLANLGIGAALYIGVGVVWSFWRFKRHADAKVEAFNKLTNPSEFSRDMLIDGISLKAMTRKIIGWVIVWPFSMIENLVGDAIRMIRYLVTNTFEYVYTMIINSAVNKLNPIKAKD